MGAFVSMVVGAVLSKYIWEYLPPLAAVGESVSGTLRTTVGVPLPNPFSGSLIVILALSFLWGVVYHVVRH